MRDLLRRGLEPFLQIRQRVEGPEAGEGLLVIALFLPSPLVEKPDREGFASKLGRGPGVGLAVLLLARRAVNHAANRAR